MIGKGGYLWGCKGETVRDYLAVLELAGLVAIDGDRVQWVGA